MFFKNDTKTGIDKKKKNFLKEFLTPHFGLGTTLTSAQDLVLTLLMD